jgi:hypothetical protein
LCSLDRQLEGTGERVQAGQKLQCDLFLLLEAFLGEFFSLGRPVFLA